MDEDIPVVEDVIAPSDDAQTEEHETIVANDGDAHITDYGDTESESNVDESVNVSVVVATPESEAHSNHCEECHARLITIEEKLSAVEEITNEIVEETIEDNEESLEESSPPAESEDKVNEVVIEEPEVIDPVEETKPKVRGASRLRRR